MKSFDPWNTILTDESGDIVWPQPYYGNALYEEVPSWIHYGDNGSRRLLFDGAFIGAEGSAPAGTSAESRRGLLAEVAPHVAPGTGPISVKKTFDEDQVLHVEICVDGKCYRTSMNLGPAIRMVMEKLAQWHLGQHRGQHAVSEHATTAVVGAIDNAIRAAGDALADTLVCQHVNVMTGSFFDDIGSAIGGTLRKLAPAISSVATGVAATYGGPAAGAAAGQLVPAVTSLQANLLDPKGDPKQRAVAQQTLQRISRMAQADPRVAHALAAAHQAVRNTALAYHVKGAVDKAAAGDPVAQQDVRAVVQAADRGDPAAKSTYEVIAHALLDKAQHSEWGAQLWEKIMGGGSGPAVSGWHGTAGGASWGYR